MKKIIFLLIPVVIALLAFRKIPSHTVKGTVTDQSGQAINGASVMEKGTKNGTKTDNSGNFTLVVSSDKATLHISSVGYESTEEKIGGRANISTILKLAKAELQEVVVTGYGVKRKQVRTTYSPAPPAAGYISPSTIDVDNYYQSTDDRTKADFNREGYDAIKENQFLKVKDNPLSTFSIDVDAASYSNVRRLLNSGVLPPAGAVRIEEMINYFKYDYAQPTGNDPFAFHTEMTDAPWNPAHKLVMVGMQGKKISTEKLPPSNLVFLLDVSGSMMSPDKLPLVKSAMKLLVDQLREEDMVSIVVYAGAAGLVLEPTSGADKTTIKDAIDELEAGGSTAGGAGIRLAYNTANKNFNAKGNNRVILCTDGDFNIGESSDDAMERLIEKERKSGIFLTVLGFGTGNYQDAKMQKLADKGNGNHAYIDGMSEAKKVLVNEFGGTLFTIAKDVKLQIEFNPAKVQGYRLIGYENRMLAAEDFNDDKKDAGELGSGHTVTALYEIIPVGVESGFLKKVDALKYQQTPDRLSATNHSGELMTVKFRYKAPDGDVSKLIEHAVADTKTSTPSENLRFAAAVAEFGLLLRNSEFKQQASFDNVIRIAKKARGDDDEGYRTEFVRLVENASRLAKKSKPVSEEGSTGSR